MTQSRVDSVEIGQIRCDPQVRTAMDDEALHGLVVSIGVHGVIVPVLLGRDERGLFMLDGHRRLAAAKRAGLASVPAIVQESPLAGPDIALLQITTAVQREDLSPIDKATAIQAVIEQTDFTAAEVAAKLGLSAASVSRLLALLKLPEAVRKDIAAGKIPASAGYQLARVADSAAQSSLAGEVAAGSLTRDGLAARRKAGASRGKSPGRGARHASKLTVTLGVGRVSVRSSVTPSAFADWLESLAVQTRTVLPQCSTLLALLQAIEASAQ